MISFLSPAFLFGAVAAALPIVLHLLKREPEPRVRFAAVKLLKHAPVEPTEKRHLRELLLLALRVAALLLLALTFARPFFSSGAAAASPSAMVVALDVSYSMSAPGRIERAHQLAKAAIDRASMGEPVGVVTFGDDAAVVARPSADRALARAAVDAVAAGYGSTRYRAGLGAAAQALGEARGTIVVVTDLQDGGWDTGERASLPETVRLEIADVGAVVSDLAVTSVRATGDRVVATVRNTGPRPVQSRARLLDPDRALAEVPLSLGPSSSTEVSFARPQVPGVAVAVDDPGGLPADDVRYLALPDRAQTGVVVVTGNGDLGRDAFYLEHALAASVDGGAPNVAGVAAGRLGTEGDAIGDAVAVLLVSTEGLERRGRETLARYVRAGGGLLIAAGPDVDGAIVADVLGEGGALAIAPLADPRPVVRTLLPADLRHPIFGAFGGGASVLGLVRFRNIARVGGASCAPIARFTSGEPALLDCAAGEGRALVLASDVGARWNDFPLHASFVPFVNEGVRYLGGRRRNGAEYLVADVPQGVAAKPGLVMAPPTSAGATARLVAVNVDPREAESARMSVGEFENMVSRLRQAGVAEARLDAAANEDRQHLWRIVILAAIATLLVEGLVARRTA